MAKIRAIADGTYDSEAERQLEKESKPKRRGRPPKSAIPTIDEDGEEGEDPAAKEKTKKKPAKRGEKKEIQTTNRPITKTKVLGPGTTVNKAKKTTNLAYEEIDNSAQDDDSELSERFDFDTEEENGPLDRDSSEASDAEKEAAVFAAAEGSLEMQVNDFDVSPVGSSSSISSSQPMGTAPSPTKKRRTSPSVNAIRSADNARQATEVKKIVPSKYGTHRGGPSQVLEVSDSD